MYHAFIVISALVAMLMVTNLVSKVGDLRDHLEDIRDHVLLIRNELSQLHVDNNFDLPKELASIEGVKAAVEDVRKAIEKATQVNTDNVNRYAQMLRDLCSEEPTPMAKEETMSKPDQDILLVEGEAIGEIITDNPDAV